MPTRLQKRRRQLLALPLGCAAGALGALATLAPPAASAQVVDLVTLLIKRQEGALTLDFVARLQLTKVVQAALERGVPVYFVAEATVFRNRWYWRDERVSRVVRTWRLAFQPLTANWRLSIGALAQTYATLPEALAAVARTSGWKLADLSQIDPDSRHYVEFAFRLDTAQLPSPMHIGLTTQADWELSIERTVRVD
ncbi:MAG: hypothetical protein RI949_2392 [Pseudomonadota bacterium]|jgi:hypothetical protein